MLKTWPGEGRIGWIGRVSVRELGVEEKRKRLPTDWHGLLEQGFRGRCFAAQLVAMDVCGWQWTGRLKRKSFAHGLARIGTDFWMGGYRGVVLSFSVIEVSGYLVRRGRARCPLIENGLARIEER